MWVTDAEGQIRFVNRSFREYLGTSYEEVEGCKWQLILHPEESREYVRAFWRAVRDHAPFRAEARGWRMAVDRVLRRAPFIQKR